ncbi:ribosome-inactivating family protein [Microbispora sp. NPDC088329]|uniref:ribosome-inactivating family protein n=1 Tax=Microbispora sp. NPDC088329 TaxID=3154869 RepID=UPI003430C3C1
MAALVVISGLGTPHARADTPDGTTKAIELQINWDFTGGNVGPYHTALIHLRQAAGRPFRDDDVYITQATPPGLIALRIGDGDTQELVSLYFNPANLYIGGFRPQNGQLFAFNDASENVRTEMARGGPVHILNFGGSYDSLIATAGGEPQIENLDGLRGAVKDLGAATLSTDRARVAADLIEMVGAFSEAARFTDFRDTWDPVFAGRSGGDFYPISTPYLRSLRGAWGRISKFALDITSVPTTPPLLIEGLWPFLSWQDVRNHLRVIRR